MKGGIRVTGPALPPIGDRLRQARLRRGMTVRGMARAAGVSASLISQIETGKSSPSVSTLYAITNALDIALEDVFGDPSDTSRAAAPDAGPGATAAVSPTARGLRLLQQHKRRVGPVVAAADREELHLDSGVTWELLGRMPDTHFDFLRITYAPGGSSSGGGVLMRHTGTEWGHVLTGQLTLTLGFDTYVLNPGDSVSFDCSTPHAYANHGLEPAVGIWFVAERVP